MGQKEFEMIGSGTHFVAFNYDLIHELDLGLQRSDFEKAVSQKWEGQFTWNERDESR